MDDDARALDRSLISVENLRRPTRPCGGRARPLRPLRPPVLARSVRSFALVLSVTVHTTATPRSRLRRSQPTAFYIIIRLPSVCLPIMFDHVLCTPCAADSSMNAWRSARTRAGSRRPLANPRICLTPLRPPVTTSLAHTSAPPPPRPTAGAPGPPRPNPPRTSSRVGTMFSGPAKPDLTSLNVTRKFRRRRLRYFKTSEATKVRVKKQLRKLLTPVRMYTKD